MSEERLAGLRASLDLTEVSPGLYRAPHVGEGRGVVFGGQLLGQAIVATTRTHPTKRVKSVQTVFAKGLKVSDPVDIRVENIYEGRNIGSARVDFIQDDRTCATCLVLTDVAEPDLISHQVPRMPDVPTPEKIAQNLSTKAAQWVEAGPHDTLIVDDVDFLDPETVRDPRLQLWVRFPDAPTNDATMSRALLSYATDGWLIATSMLPHRGIGQSMAHVSISTGVLTHSLAFHNEFEAGQWILIDHVSQFAGGGRVYGRGHVYTREGLLVSSFVQESLVRNFPTGQDPKGKESTIF